MRRRGVAFSKKKDCIWSVLQRNGKWLIQERKLTVFAD
jgi:hypothetical protein